MDPIIVKLEEGGWICKLCRTVIRGATDAVTHPNYAHMIDRDMTAMDPEGHIYDLRGVGLDDLRAAGMI